MTVWLFGVGSVAVQAVGRCLERWTLLFTRAGRCGYACCTRTATTLVLPAHGCLPVLELLFVLVRLGGNVTFALATALTQQNWRTLFQHCAFMTG